MKRTEELQLRLSEEDYILLQRLAEHLGTSMSKALAYALESFLKQVEADSK